MKKGLQSRIVAAMTPGADRVGISTDADEALEVLRSR